MYFLLIKIFIVYQYIKVAYKTFEVQIKRNKQVNTNVSSQIKNFEQKLKFCIIWLKNDISSIPKIPNCFFKVYKIILQIWKNLQHLTLKILSQDQPYQNTFFRLVVIFPVIFFNQNSIIKVLFKITYHNYYRVLR